MGWGFIRFLVIVLIVGVLAMASCSRNPSAFREPGPAAPNDAFTQLQFEQSKDVTAATIEDSYRVQASLAQLFRWFQAYDSREVSLSGQLDLLSDDVAFESNSGTGQGRSSYMAQANAVPKTWDHAHFVREVSVVFASDDNIRLEANVIYLNRGALEQDAVHGANIDFHSTMVGSTQALPDIKQIEIDEKSSGRSEAFRSSYVENRLKSLLHHWLYLVENPNRSAEQFDQILSEEFKLNFPKSRITSDEGLREWLAGPASAVKAMHYRVRDFSFEVLGTNEYGMAAEIDWYGLMENGDQLTGRVLQEFAVIDDPGNAFATITSIREQELVPGSLRPDEDDLLEDALPEGTLLEDES